MADVRMQPDSNPMPFDGTRLIYGGFVPVCDTAKWSPEPLGLGQRAFHSRHQPSGLIGPATTRQLPLPS